MANQCNSCTINVPPAIKTGKDIPRLVGDQLGDVCELCRSFEVMQDCTLCLQTLIQAILSK